MNFNQAREQHDAQNEKYIAAKTDLFSKEEFDNKKWAELAENRLTQLFEAVDKVEATDNYVDFIDCMVSLFDDVILECAMVTNTRKEVETKLLEPCKQAMSQPTTESKRDSKNEHIVCAIIDGLLITEATTKQRANAMNAGIIHETNPLRLGLCFYEIFTEKYPEDCNSELTEYLKCEAALRYELTMGNPQEATEIATELLKMKMTTPEKFLLMSMVAFYSGLADDAARTLEIGLNQYPGNERILKAQEGLQAALG